MKGYGQGGKNVAVAGTPVQLVAASTPCRRLAITARPANVGKIAVGYSNAVHAAAGAEQGVVLAAGQTYDFACSDVFLVWIDASNANDGVSFAFYDPPSNT